jgi:hypothetical protein
MKRPKKLKLTQADCRLLDQIIFSAASRCYVAAPWIDVFDLCASSRRSIMQTVRGAGLPERPKLRRFVTVAVRKEFLSLANRTAKEFAKQHPELAEMPVPSDDASFGLNATLAFLRKKSGLNDQAIAMVLRSSVRKAGNATADATISREIEHPLPPPLHNEEQRHGKKGRAARRHAAPRTDVPC